jgi:hypothetical protein
MALTTSATAPTDAEIVKNVRERAGLAEADGGPSDEQIAQGVRGFADAFRYWYNRVLDEVLPKYESKIIDRVNPMIRGMQLEGLPADEVARRLVGDYAHRNYVTAGGWALEKLAIDGSPRLRKSTATGIDAEWYESESPPVVNLYVIKSGTVTRNSDILAQLKSHGQEAQKRMMQTDKKAVVRTQYIVTAGNRSSTFHAGVYRPSSAEFWAQTFDLEDDEETAIDLALAMAQEAGSLLPDPTDDDAVRALEAAVAAFIAAEADPTVVDWEFLAQRNMIGGAAQKAESKKRHKRAVQAVKDAGYAWPATGRAKKKAAAAAAEAEAAAEDVADAVADLPAN